MKLGDLSSHSEVFVSVPRLLCPSTMALLPAFPPSSFLCPFLRSDYFPSYTWSTTISFLIIFWGCVVQVLIKYVLSRWLLVCEATGWWNLFSFPKAHCEAWKVLWRNCAFLEAPGGEGCAAPGRSVRGKGAAQPSGGRSAEKEWLLSPDWSLSFLSSLQFTSLATLFTSGGSTILSQNRSVVVIALCPVRVLCEEVSW